MTADSTVIRLYQHLIEFPEIRRNQSETQLYLVHHMTKSALTQFSHIDERTHGSSLTTPGIGCVGGCFCSKPNNFTKVL